MLLKIQAGKVVQISDDIKKRDLKKNYSSQPRDKKIYVFYYFSENMGPKL